MQKYKQKSLKNTQKIGIEWIELAFTYSEILMFRNFMWGTQVAQLAKCMTLHFGLGHDFMVRVLEHHIGLQTVELCPSSLSLSFSFLL